jgi:hypothetical protein
MKVYVQFHTLLTATNGSVLSVQGWHTFVSAFTRHDDFWKNCSTYTRKLWAAKWGHEVFLQHNYNNEIL